MCGICGVVDWTGSGDAEALVRRMTPTMTHRGPDDEGFADWGPRAEGKAQSTGRRGALSLGMRRLSIIDVAGGHQPMFNADRTIAAILNGEIYNFQKLQNQLKDRGHAFHTRSDSEVVAHAYEEWGAECVERFEGMFAIAVWDGRAGQKAEGSRQKAEGGKHKAEGGKHKAEGSEQQADNVSGAAAKLFLARDRLGIKPLYYYAEVQSPSGKVQSPKSNVQSPSGKEVQGPSGKEVQSPMSNVQCLSGPEGLAGERSTSPDEGHWTLDIGPWTRFLFASEVRTLLASGIVPKRLSREALESYLLFGSVSEPMTLVEGVLSLPPGHRMTIELDQNCVAPQPEAYWAITSKGSVNAGESLAGNGRVDKSDPVVSDIGLAAARVRELLEASVRKHLIADVPVGVFLSGGIDSTALAGLASREVSGVHTFTVAFPEKEFSEAAIARRTAERFGTTHQEVMLSGDEMLAQLGQAVGALDQPTMDGVNTYFVSQAARQAGLKVTLSGLGGDEVFGGYNTFSRTPALKMIGEVGGRVPKGIREAVASVAGGAVGSRARGDVVRKMTALWNDSQSLPHPYFFGRALFTPPQVAELMTEKSTNGDAPWRRWLTDSAAQASAFDPFTAVTCMEAQSYLVNTLLRDTDSMSMAHSLEVRVPFLDHPLVEFVTQLPQEVKLRKGKAKALLSAALVDLLPAEVVDQAKRGFTFPWASWLRGPLRKDLDEGFGEFAPALAEAIDAGKAREIWQDYLAGKTSWSRPWSLYVLNEWVKRNLG